MDQNGMLEFEQLEWAHKNMRGMQFGKHGKSYVYLKGRHIVVHVRTGATSEIDVGFELGASIPGFGPRFVDAVFKEANTDQPIEFRSMYMSDDGIDPLSLKKTGSPYIPRIPRENAALKPNTDYYLTIDIHDEGPAGWDPQIRMVYHGTDYEGQHIITLDTSGSVDITLNGTPGTWSPKPKASTGEF